MHISTRIILVNTSLPANIGAAARAMKTMGLSELVLVAPKQFPHADASSLASNASDVLANARIVATLEEAIADCQFVFGSSARQRTIGLAQVDARTAGRSAQAQAATGAKVAFVFGREDRGLSNEELQLCHSHVFIPSNSEYGVLNVAAAVQVIAYETRMAHLEQAPDSLEAEGVAGAGGIMPVTFVGWDEELVRVDDMATFYEHFERTLVAVDFLDPENPRQIMTRLRRLYGRTRLDRPEYNLMRGFFKRILELVAKGGTTKADANHIALKNPDGSDHV